MAKARWGTHDLNQSERELEQSSNPQVPRKACKIAGQECEEMIERFRVQLIADRYYLSRSSSSSQRGE